MKKQWLCISCLEQVALDAHGRCGTCGSDAVDRIINLDVSDHGPRGIEIRPRSHTDH